MIGKKDNRSFYPATERVWETADGKAVPEGHLEAVRLAYKRGDLIPEKTAKKMGLVKPPKKKPATKKK
jgi:hypothetical protein